MSNKKPTMKDVAREAGVALGTVSKVFNGIAVGKAYRDRVEAAAAQLGYSVDNYARGLRSGRTSTVALIVPGLEHSFFSSLANAVSTEDMSRSDPNDVSTIASGIDQIHSYFSGFYLDTCPWASGKRLRKSVNAIRSFYATMKEHGKISAAEYKRLNKIIATFLPRWEVMAEIKWGE